MNKGNVNNELIAILRGIEPEESGVIAKALSEIGFTKIEVPLNSPNPYESIGKMRECVSDDVLIGAGTVLNQEQVNLVYKSGGQFVVSPNFNEKVVMQTLKHGMLSYPGVASLTEAFNALEVGATGLKLFPATFVGLDNFKAYKAVLPVTTKIYGVGGIQRNDYDKWLQAGMTGFGIGSDLYKKGMTLEIVKNNAKSIIESYYLAVKSIG